MTENIYSCFHYHEKCKKDREATEKAVSEAKGYADSINPATLVNIGSDQTIDGRKTLTKPITARMNTVEENTPPTQNQYIDWITPVDKNGLGMGYLGVADYADGRRGSRIGHTRTKSDGSKVYASIDVGTDKNGTTYTSAPNPPSNSNGTAIVTTSWVNNAGAVVKSKSLADNGYIKFSSGLIIQWGLALNGNLTTFPTPFTSATSWAITTGYCGAGSTDKMWGQIHDRKNTSFDWVAADSSEQMYWIAIGY